MTKDLRRDWISSTAMFGAPFLVGVLLLCRILNGNCESVAIIAATFAIVFVLYLRFVPLAEVDDGVSPGNVGNPVANGGTASSTDHETQSGR